MWCSAGKSKLDARYEDIVVISLDFSELLFAFMRSFVLEPYEKLWGCVFWEKKKASLKTYEKSFSVFLRSSFCVGSKVRIGILNQ